MPEKKVFEVHIEQGHKYGAKVVLRGEAGMSELGVLPGDVIFVLEPKPHKTFKRVGNDLILDKVRPPAWSSNSPVTCAGPLVADSANLTQAMRHGLLSVAGVRNGTLVLICQTPKQCVHSLKCTLEASWNGPLIGKLCGCAGYLAAGGAVRLQLQRHPPRPTRPAGALPV